jgi:hypothetical protein
MQYLIVVIGHRPNIVHKLVFLGYCYMYFSYLAGFVVTHYYLYLQFYNVFIIQTVHTTSDCLCPQFKTYLFES